MFPKDITEKFITKRLDNIKKNIMDITVLINQFDNLSKELSREFDKSLKNDDDLNNVNINKLSLLLMYINDSVTLLNDYANSDNFKDIINQVSTQLNETETSSVEVKKYVDHFTKYGKIGKINDIIDKMDESDNQTPKSPVKHIVTDESYTWMRNTTGNIPINPSYITCGDQGVIKKDNLNS